MVHVDYIIVGQGISGTFLSYYLLKAGKKVLVVDEYNPVSASRIASGVINPVTGRRVVTTWMIDELLPFAMHAYDDVGSAIGYNLATEVNMVNFHASEQMQSAWYSRMAEGCEYISGGSNAQNYREFFHMPYGIGLTYPCLLIDLELLLGEWRQLLKLAGNLWEEKFRMEDVHIGVDAVAYKGIYAEKLILCNGIHGFNNPYFSKLPYTYNKGEVLILEINGLPPSAIYKYGISLVPLGNDTFWAGSSFEWDYMTEGPTELFRRDIENTLNKWLKLPYRVLDHKASIRPASVERKPFVGLHPDKPAVGILNGMGTKGCSLAPFFASQFADFLISGTKIIPEADVSRFRRLLNE